MKKRIALLIAFLLFLAGATACVRPKKCEHVDANDDKKCDLCQENYDDGPEEKVPYEFKTPVTDSITLNESYEGKDFLEDGIGTATIVAFTDGDTAMFRTSGGHKITVRFLGIDTPESTYKVDPWGFAASAYTKNAIKNAKTIVLQAETLDPNARLDSTGNRYLAWVWVDGRLLNLEIAEVGLAAAKAEGTRYASQFIEAIQPVLKAKERIYGVKNDPDYNYTSTRKEFSIKELREQYGSEEAINTLKDNGLKIKVTGTVVRKIGGACAYIQQYGEDGKYYGIYIYGGYGTIGTLKPGYTVTVSGTIGYYYGQLQISSVTTASVKVMDRSGADTLVPIETKLADITKYDYDSIANFITLNEELVITSYYDSENNTSFTLTTNYQLSDGNFLDIRVDQNTALFDEKGIRITSGKSFVGKTISSFTGILSYYDPNYGQQDPEKYDGRIQLMWADESDVIFK